MSNPGPIGRSGTMIVVVGPSGAGKDSVIDFAMAQLKERPDISLVRRIITRPQDAGGEVHEAMSPEAFKACAARGGFSVAWEAHGLHYGIPAEARDQLKAGGTLIANGSRAVLGRFHAAFPRVATVNIVASPEVIARRLVARGRESEADIRLRLSRQVPDLCDIPDLTTIDNSGPLEEAGTRFAALVLAISDRDRA